MPPIAPTRGQGAPGKRANASAKNWRILRKIRSSPAHTTVLVNANQSLILTAELLSLGLERAHRCLEASGPGYRTSLLPAGFAKH